MLEKMLIALAGTASEVDGWAGVMGGAATSSRVSIRCRCRCHNNLTTLCFSRRHNHLLLARFSASEGYYAV